MSKIKFRTWNSDDKKMQFPSVIAICNDGEFKPLINCSDGNKSYKDYPLMQFTGLTDVKGKEWYEGDYDENKNVVELRDGCFFLGSVPLALSANHRTISGNIYENPIF